VAASNERSEIAAASAAASTSSTRFGPLASCARTSARARSETSRRRVFFGTPEFSAPLSEGGCRFFPGNGEGVSLDFGSGFRVSIGFG
jgi:hypothetical protein